MAIKLHARLARVERCVARAEANLERQRAWIERLTQHGQDSETPEKVLGVLQEILPVAQGHRDLILGEIAARAGRHY